MPLDLVSSSVLDLRLCAQICTAPEVSVDVFCKAVLPALTTQQVEAIHTKFVQDGLITSSSQWKLFENTPRLSQVREQLAFKPMEELVTRIIKVSTAVVLHRNQKQLRPNVSCSCDGDERPAGDRNDTSRPDGWLNVKSSWPLNNKESLAKIRLEDIFCSFGFKKGESRADKHDVRDSSFLFPIPDG